MALASPPAHVPGRYLLGFSVPGIPVGQGNHRRAPKGKGMYETTKGHAQWRQDVMLSAECAMRAAGFHQRPLIEGQPVVLSARFWFPRPPSHLTQSGRLKKGKPERKITAPDLSKLVRSIEDAMTRAGVWADDSLVVGYSQVFKDWCEYPFQAGAEVYVRPV